MCICPFHYFITGKLQLSTLHFIPKMSKINSLNSMNLTKFSTGKIPLFSLRILHDLLKVCGRSCLNLDLYLVFYSQLIGEFGTLCFCTIDNRKPQEYIRFSIRLRSGHSFTCYPPIKTNYSLFVVYN